MRKRATDYPLVWLALFIVIALAAGRVLPPWPALRPLGWLVAAAGLGLMQWSVLVMRRARATVDPTSPPTALVTHGPFRRSRNPIYLGVVMVLAGACLLAAAPCVLVLPPLLGWIIGRRFIPQEEAWLAGRYPRAFAAWAARTPRWL